MRKSRTTAVIITAAVTSMCLPLLLCGLAGRYYIKSSVDELYEPAAAKARRSAEGLPAFAARTVKQHGDLTTQEDVDAFVVELPHQVIDGRLSSDGNVIIDVLIFGDNSHPLFPRSVFLCVRLTTAADGTRAEVRDIDCAEACKSKVSQGTSDWCPIDPPSGYRLIRLDED